MSDVELSSTSFLGGKMLVVTESEWAVLISNLKDGEILSIISKNADGTRIVSIEKLWDVSPLN